MFIVVNNGKRLYVFDVHVPTSEDVEQLDVEASTVDEACRLATEQADELYAPPGTVGRVYVNGSPVGDDATHGLPVGYVLHLVQIV